MNKLTIFRSMLLSLMVTGVMMTGFSFTAKSSHEMVAVCHYDENYLWPTTIRVPPEDVNEHLEHGDYPGFCQAAVEDLELRERADTKRSRIME